MTVVPKEVVARPHPSLSRLKKWDSRILPSGACSECSWKATPSTMTRRRRGVARGRGPVPGQALLLPTPVGLSLRCTYTRAFRSPSPLESNAGCQRNPGRSGAIREGVRGHCGQAGQDAQSAGVGHVRLPVERTLRLQALQAPAPVVPLRQPESACAAGPGKCRRPGVGRRPLSRLQDRVAQSSLGRRAVPGGGHGSWRHCPGHPCDGRKAHCPAEFAPFRPPHNREGTGRSSGVWWGASPGMATVLAFPTLAERPSSPRPMRATPSSTRCCIGLGPPRRSDLLRGNGRWQSDLSGGRRHGTGRYPRRLRSRLQGSGARKGTQVRRSGGEPLPGEGAHRGVPGNGRGRGAGGNAGPWRRRPHQLSRRERGEGCRWSRVGTRQRAAARARHDALRGDAVGVSGAHVAHRQGGGRSQS